MKIQIETAQTRGISFIVSQEVHSQHIKQFNRGKTFRNTDHTEDTSRWINIASLVSYGFCRTSWWTFTEWSCNCQAACGPHVHGGKQVDEEEHDLARTALQVWAEITEATIHIFHLATEHLQMHLTIERTIPEKNCGTMSKHHESCTCSVGLNWHTFCQEDSSKAGTSRLPLAFPHHAPRVGERSTSEPAGSPGHQRMRWDLVRGMCCTELKDVLLKWTGCILSHSGCL